MTRYLKRRIFEAWLACYSQQEIADQENLTQQAVALVVQDFADLQKLVKSDKAAAEHATDFDVPNAPLVRSAGRCEAKVCKIK